MVDVVVAGGGPAGRAISASCSDLGLGVCLVDPAPRRSWSNTYSAWLDELPTIVANEATAAVAEQMWIFGGTARKWPRAYAVLDNEALFAHLWRADITEVNGKVASVETGRTGCTVRLRDGRRIASAVVVDASGSSRVLTGGRPRRTSAQQSAVGVVVPATAAQAVLEPGSGVFMDWRQQGKERVLFPVDDPPPRRSRMVPYGLIPFGAAAGLVHPASGFSVATSLRLAPSVAAAIKQGLPEGPPAAAAGAWSALWPSGVVVAHALHRRALDALLAMPSQYVPEFFDLFFGIDEQRQRTFLSSQAGFWATGAAMYEVFRSAPWHIRANLARALLPTSVHGRFAQGEEQLRDG